MKTHLVARASAQGEGDMGVGAEDRLQLLKPTAGGGVRAVRGQHGHQAFGMAGEVLPVQQATALAASSLSQGQQARQARIGGAIGRIDEDHGAVRQLETAADDQAHPRGLGRFMSADDSGQAVAISDRQGFETAGGRLGEQLLAGAGAPQKREVGCALELGVPHPNRPWMNQAWEPVRASRPSPARNSQKRSPASSSTWK
ncbi:hypothetical protein D3C86_1261150 [compost metagenome]